MSEPEKPPAAELPEHAASPATGPGTAGATAAVAAAARQGAASGTGAGPADAGDAAAAAPAKKAVAKKTAQAAPAKKTVAKKTVAKKTPGSGPGRRAATPGTVRAPAPAPQVVTDTTSVPTPSARAGGPPAKALRAAEQARSAGDARAAAAERHSRSGTEQGLISASVRLPFVQVSVALPQGARVHLGPVDAGLGPRGLAVVGAAGALAVGVIEWPLAAALVGAGVVMRRMRRRGPHR